MIRHTAVPMRAMRYAALRVSRSHNDRLDFFGQTANIPARVQGLADADEIYLTDEV